MICTECGNKLVKVNTPLVEEFRGEEFTVKGIDKLNTAIFEQYCKKHGILDQE